ncbi:MAG TPA: MBL fold metallo-hydrolase [Thermoplasmata archaeon]|nr:MBL fold metallo-hydrolase [Thermoplasmata archaeon]
MTEVRELGRGRLLVDLGFRDTEGLVASYLIPGAGGWTVVETGPTPCVARLLDGLSAAGIEPAEVQRVLVTHIHLDHAGGAGALAEALPRATFYVHRAGLTHLIGPERLIASARRAWGSAADSLWGTIVPLPADRAVALDGGEGLDVREGRLEVLATPGHARHHLAFLDTATRAMLTGDAAGVRLSTDGHARPTVPAPDLDLEQLFASLDRMADATPRELWYTHFGPAPGSREVLERYRRDVEAWRDVALAAAREDPAVASVATALQAHESSATPPDPGSVSLDRGTMVSSYELSAQGLLRYFRTRGLLAAEGP